MQFGNQMEAELSEELRKEIDGILAKDKVVVFMKGNKAMPQCGFSDAVVKVLNFHGAEFADYDVLSRPELRSGMKVYSEWATFPQLYINKEFIGGCDIVMDMHEKGELEPLLKA
ncbi:MAG: Grx4 family monothiol glutaredoxin [Candidatus Melainabacteria bacterium]|nr:Grx4 family monothiol glutaredoxin [Candidatus Melainabacteria bacterium]